MFLKTLFSLFEKLFRHKKTKCDAHFFAQLRNIFFCINRFQKIRADKNVFARVDISEIVFYTIFLKFSKWVTKFEDYDESRSFDGRYENVFPINPEILQYYTMIRTVLRIRIRMDPHLKSPLGSRR